MTALFTVDEMTECLVTGKRIKQQDQERKLLDHEKVTAIIGEYKGCFSTFFSVKHMRLRFLEIVLFVEMFYNFLKPSPLLSFCCR